MVYNRICRQCGCSLVVKHQLPKLNLRVRFPLSAPRRSKLYIACSDFLYKKSEFAHATAPRRGEPFDSPHFYQKYGFALSACRSFFPKSCAFGEFRCRFAAFAPPFAKRHARLVCSFASALTDGSLSLPPFCEYGCGANFSIARRFSFLYAKNPRLTQAVKSADFSN